VTRASHLACYKIDARNPDDQNKVGHGRDGQNGP
jgi:hypothetical protein